MATPRRGRDNGGNSALICGRSRDESHRESEHGPDGSGHVLHTHRRLPAKGKALGFGLPGLAPLYSSSFLSAAADSDGGDDRGWAPTVAPAAGHRGSASRRRRSSINSATVIALISLITFSTLDDGSTVRPSYFSPPYPADIVTLASQYVQIHPGKAGKQPAPNTDATGVNLHPYSRLLSAMRLSALRTLIKFQTEMTRAASDTIPAASARQNGSMMDRSSSLGVGVEVYRPGTYGGTVGRCRSFSCLTTPPGTAGSEFE